MALFYLWRIFNRLRRRVGSNGFGANPITWPDIDAFCRHSRFYLVPWEIEILEMLDNVFLEQQSKSQAGDTTTTAKD
jgi:hypothetical protein